MSPSTEASPTASPTASATSGAASSGGSGGTGTPVVFCAAALAALGRAADVVMRTVERGDLFVLDADDATDFDPSVFEADLVAACDAFEEAALLVTDTFEQSDGSQVTVSAPGSAWWAALEVLEVDRLSSWAPMRALVTDLERALAA